MSQRGEDADAGPDAAPGPDAIAHLPPLADDDGCGCNGGASAPLGGITALFLAGLLFRKREDSGGTRN